MGLFWWKNKKEIRADTETIAADTAITTEEALVTALIGKGKIGVEEALAIPEVQYCLDVIGGTIAGLPIRLHRIQGDKVEEVKGDNRVKLLNSDTGDALTSTQFWKAMLEDYFFSKHGGFAYINKTRNRYKSLHYVSGMHISCVKMIDPIFKDYDVYVEGKKYMPHEFLKIMRKTKDGSTNETLISEANLLLSVAYACYKFKNQLVRKGGSKKGFLKSERPLDELAMTKLKEAYKKLYSNGDENVVILNNGMDFQEAGNTSVEMELADHIESNSRAIERLFGISEENDSVKCIIRIVQDIESSLNRDMLKESEKDSCYFAFDTRQIIRGSIKERYEAYKIGIESNFIQVDEARQQEDLNPLGIDWITLGLDQVLYNPVTKECFTPNTKQLTTLDGKAKGGEEGGNGD